jgi:hypothetical protein
MPKVSVKEFQRRIVDLDATYIVTPPKRAHSFRVVVALIILALTAMSVVASIHINTNDEFARLTLKQGTTTPKDQLSDAEAQAKWNAIWGAATTGVERGE